MKIVLPVYKDSIIASLMDLLFKSRIYDLSLNSTNIRPFLCQPDDPAPGNVEAANALFQGRFAFGGEEKSVLNEAPWILAGASDAWIMEANSFEWLSHFQATNGETARLRALELVRSWIEVNKRWQKRIWRSDIIGRRLASWACHGVFLLDGAEPTFRRNFLKSFEIQTRHLRRVNAFLPKRRATLPAVAGHVIAEIVLDGVSKRLESGLHLLKEQLSRDIFPDGTPKSRNACDSILALRLLLIVRSGLLKLEIEEPGFINEAIKKLAHSARSFRHGDGGFANLNGSGENNREYLNAILTSSRVRGASAASLKDGGLQRISRERSLVLFDVGVTDREVVDIYAGLLSFELSVGYDRIIVNCGNANGSQWGELSRATAAHSTVTICDTNSLNTSGSRAREVLTHASQVQRREEGGSVLVEAYHQGYEAKFGLRHKRSIFMSPCGNEIRGEDQITAVRTKGKNSYSYSIRFHLHPKVNASLASDRVTALFRLPNGKGMRFRASSEVSLEESIYFGGTDGARNTQQAVIYGITNILGLTTVKWAFTLY